MGIPFPRQARTDSVIDQQALIGAVGLACGGDYSIAIITLMLAFATLTLITYLEGKMHQRLQENDDAGSDHGSL